MVVRVVYSLLLLAVVKGVNVSGVKRQERKCGGGGVGGGRW